MDDGSSHFGDLELITWEGVDEDGDHIGWGNVYAEESAELKRQYEEDFKCDDVKMFEEWPHGYRSISIFRYKCKNLSDACFLGGLAVVYLAMRNTAVITTELGLCLASATSAGQSCSFTAVHTCHADWT